MSETFSRRLVLGLVVSLLFAVHAQAAVHMTDSFLSGGNPAAGEYSVGALVGQNPTVSTFNSAWAAGLTTTTPGAFSAVASGITWPDLTSVAGGAVQFVNNEVPATTQVAKRTFTNANMVALGNYYLVGLMSFDENFVNSANPTNSSALTGIVNAEEGDPSALWIVGMQWGFRGNATGGVDAVARYRDTVGGVAAVREYVLASNVTPGNHLFVTYVDSDWDGVHSGDWNDVWFDPGLGNGFYSAGPSKLSKQGNNWLNPNDPYDNTRVVDTVVCAATDLGAGAVVKYDEVRLGDTWQEVVHAGGSVSSTGAVFFANPVDPYDHAGTYYREAAPDSARGTQTVLQVGSVEATPPATSRLRSSLSFSLDAVPNGTTVTSATLTLYVSRVDETGGDAAVDLYLADLPDTFDETKATWNAVAFDEFGFPTPWGGNGPGNPTSLLASAVDFETGVTTETVFSSSALLAAIQSAINGDTPLDLALIAPADIENSGLRRFVEFYSDDATNYFLRPVLLLSFVAIPGDTNGDGKVNDVDAKTVAANWGSSSATGPSQGDFNADGLVNAADASIMAANWGYGTSEGASVPEPSMLLVVVVTLAMVVLRRRQG
jgi:hypothetical protein